MKTLAEYYAESRQAVYPAWGKPYHPTASEALQRAQDALHGDKVRKAWDDLGGHYTCITEGGGHSNTEGANVRIVCRREHIDWDDLLGEGYNPETNPSIPESILEQQEQEFTDTVNRDGVWWYSSEFWDGEEWQVADSISGVVGSLFESGYDVDLMQFAMDELSKVEPEMDGLDEFTTGYMEAIAFTDFHDDTGIPVGSEFSRETVKNIEADCRSFWNRFKYLVSASPMSPDYAGHDFWLSRNGHGAGFWCRDHPWEYTANMLTTASQGYGGCLPTWETITRFINPSVYGPVVLLTSVCFPLSDLKPLVQGLRY